MREKLIAELTALKESIVKANEEVYTASRQLMVAKDALRVKEESLLLSGVINGKNAEIRAAQISELTIIEHQEVMDVEDYLENAKKNLNNLRAELQINLALVELVKGVA